MNEQINWIEYNSEESEGFSWKCFYYLDQSEDIHFIIGGKKRDECILEKVYQLYIPSSVFEYFSLDREEVLEKIEQALSVGERPKAAFRYDLNFTVETNDLWEFCCGIDKLKESLGELYTSHKKKIA